jgi:hypothetical protein
MPQGKTDNLMDYTRGARHIAKWQWDLMHDPGIVVRVFERDKDAAGLFKHNMSGIRYNDSLVANNQTLYFLPQLKEKVKFLAKKDKKDNAEEQLKVEWKVKDRKEKSDSLVFTADADFFGNELQIKITAKDDFLLGLGKDSLININIEKIEIDIESIVDSLMSNLQGIKRDFDSLQKELPEHVEENMDAFSIMESKYISRGMNSEFETPPATSEKMLEQILSRIYYLDKRIAEMPDLDKYIAEIRVMSDDTVKKTVFIQNVVKSVKTIDPFAAKDFLEKQYREALILKFYEQLNVSIKK